MSDTRNTSTRAAITHPNEVQPLFATGTRQRVRLLNDLERRYPEANEPLIGYFPLEQAQAAVDMLGHRLIKVSRVDLK
jgi:hypothetical protein